MSICVTNDLEAARADAFERFDGYQNAPSYKAMLDLEGASHGADIAVIGDEATVGAELRRLASIGVTDLGLVEMGTADERRHTRAFLAGNAW